MDNNMTTIWSVLKKFVCYPLAFAVLLLCWINLTSTPFIVLATGHFVAMYLIAKGGN